MIIAVACECGRRFEVFVSDAERAVECPACGRSVVASKDGAGPAARLVGAKAPPTSGGRPRGRMWPTAGIVLAAVGAFALVAAATYAVEALMLRSARDGVAVDMRPEPPGSWLRAEADGVRTPPAVAAEAAEAAGLDDAEEVIGVVVAGVPRAYRLAALRDPRRHVVNDLVGGAAVSVAYCDRTGCIRTYTGPGAGPLRVGIAGLRDGGLVVKLDGVYYDHRSGRVVEGPPGAAPLAPDQVPWTRTTWGRWRAEHPTTDVSVGPAAGPNLVDPRRPSR